MVWYDILDYMFFISQSPYTAEYLNWDNILYRDSLYLGLAHTIKSGGECEWDNHSLLKPFCTLVTDILFS